MSLKRHDALPFLPLGDQAMGTMFPILRWLAHLSAGGLSRRGTMSIPVRRALGVTCSNPPMRAYMVQGLNSGLRPHPPTAPHPLIGVCARPSAGVCCMYVSIPVLGPHTHNPRVA